jgi:hypothetical protein
MMRATIGMRSRRGVLLLIVLGLLAMFGVVAITFVIIASQHRRAADVLADVGKNDDNPEKALNDVFHQLVRGPNETAATVGNERMSAIGPHSLLEDEYGTSGTASYGAITAYPLCGGQIMEIYCTSITKPWDFGGHVLTMTSGPAKGQSRHVLGWRQRQFTDPKDPSQPAITWNLLQVAAFDGTTVGRKPGDAAGADPEQYILAKGERLSGDFIISPNLPYSGTGFGYDGTSHEDTAAATHTVATGLTLNAPVALLPNTVYEPRRSANATAANEDWDAVDFQNMALAGILPIQAVDPGNQTYTPGPPPSSPVKAQVIPSFHRPELVLYWANHDPLWNFVPADPANPTAAEKDQLRYRAFLRRNVLMRPSTDDHPKFPSIDLINGPWDVDNDGDGVADSIWIDPGLPVRTTRDGRQYKTMAAVMCLDMDGRLNLNAHGCLAQVRGNEFYYKNVPTDGSTYRFAYDKEVSDNSNSTTGSTAAYIARGQGMGPAEVNLLPLFRKPYQWEVSGVKTNDKYNFIEYQQLLNGMIAGAKTLDGRYGESDRLRNSEPLNMPAAGKTDGVDLPSTNPLQKLLGSTANDIPSYNQLWDVPNNYADFTFLTSYATPPDLKGRLAVGVDLAGQPLYAILPDFSDWNLTNPGGGTTNNPPTYAYGTSNDPYELNLWREAAHGVDSPSTVDNPFSPAELERLLRPFDRDTESLPSRLVNLLSNTLSEADILKSPRDLRYPLVIFPRSMRMKATTESWDVVTPGVLGSESLVRLVWSKLSGTDQQRAEKIAQLLAPELLVGMRMDVNRPFGNGLDDVPPTGSANGVVDEPEEAALDDARATDDPNEAWEKMPYADRKAQPLSRKVGTDDIYYPSVCHTNGLDVNGDNTLDAADRVKARELYARHIYVMLKALTDDSHIPQWIEERAKRVTPNWDANRKKYERNRWLAQWAVNVVDFRDRDSIMTRFKFDEDPFDGWNEPADTDLEHTVWGCERPELLLTESIAFHDRRTENLANETPANGGVANTTKVAVDPDTDFDQKLKPEGSLFLELYNPWLNHGTSHFNGGKDQYNNDQSEPAPGEFYANGGIDLKKKASDGSPIWRLAIPKCTERNLDPDDPKLWSGGGVPTYERAVYFIKPFKDPKDAEVAYSPTQTLSNTVAPLKPGRYAVVGPGPDDMGNSNYESVTYIGADTSGNRSATTRRITLKPGAAPDTGVTVDSNGTIGGMPTAGIEPPAAIVINDAQKNDGTTVHVRLSVTEPVEGYEAIAQAEPGPGGGNVYDPNTGYPTPYDTPFDQSSHSTLQGEMKGHIKSTETHASAQVVYLQRLANPLEPYNSITNPYRTVDAIQVDLTCFNSKPTPGPDPDDPSTGSVRFHTRERGQAYRKNYDDKYNPPPSPPAPAAGTFDPLLSAHNVWTQEPVINGAGNLEDDGKDTSNSSNTFAPDLRHSLGYLNARAFGAPRNADAGSGSGLALPKRYHGQPYGKPFPWLTWNNRPFVSPMELMLVPAPSSSKLLAWFNCASPWPNYNRDNPNPYDSSKFNPEETDQYKSNEDTRLFGHLQDFFAGDASAPELYRIFEYLGVPSPFVGSQIQGNPAKFNMLVDSSPATASQAGSTSIRCSIRTFGQGC